MPPYKRRKEANKVSYLWDHIIQKTCQNALDGTLLGDNGPLIGKSAIHEMAKEPRFSRRALSDAMTRAVANFPETNEGARNLSFMPSFYEEKGFVFLQVKPPPNIDYENKYRPARRHMLEVACAAAKNKFPHLKKIIGIGTEAPKYSDNISEDFVLLECEDWPEKTARHYERENEDLQFFQTKDLKKTVGSISDFPTRKGILVKKKVGRNQKCPCGSGKKYKHCCLQS